MSEVWDFLLEHKSFLGALVIAGILIIPVKLNASTQQVPYQRTESYVVTSTTTTAFQITKNAQWNITWYVHKGGSWGELLGTEHFPAIFQYDYVQGTLYKNYSDYVGFIGSMEINVSRIGPVNFLIGSDDGSQLYVDSKLVIDNPESSGLILNPLSPAYHPRITRNR